MKRNILNTLWMAAVLPLALVSCQQEELPGVTDTAGAQVLSITVTDGGYHSDDNAAGMTHATRATENGYSTEFAAGDACGLYIVRNGSVVNKNVKLTATEQGGNIVWQPDAGVTLIGGLPGETYFLYYPYREDVADKTDAAATTDDAAFFAPLINDWQPAEDQSNYATGYAASDLMTAQGYATTSGGTVQLSFSMTHRMALAVIESPNTVYKFTNATTIPDYTLTSTLDFTDSKAKPCLMADGTLRYLVNPASTAPGITGSYVDGRKEFTVTPSGITAGQYKTYKVDGGANEIQYNLQVGDFLMVDGTLVSKDVTLTDEQKANVAAIVFWSPAETDPTGRTTPASLTDDKILKADFPNCVHGLAVAVKNTTYSGSETMAWQDQYEFVKDFQSSNNFTHKNKSQFASIASGEGNTANINRILGYQNTQVLLAYNNYCTKNGKGSYIVKPAASIAEFALANPAPAGSTGWYLPSLKELHILCYKDVDDVNSVSDDTYTQTRDIVNASFTAAGDVYGENGLYSSYYYWTSSEYEDNNYLAFTVYFGNAWVFRDSKPTVNRVRAVCAF